MNKQKLDLEKTKGCFLINPMEKMEITGKMGSMVTMEGIFKFMVK